MKHYKFLLLILILLFNAYSNNLSYAYGDCYDFSITVLDDPISKPFNTILQKMIETGLYRVGDDISAKARYRIQILYKNDKEVIMKILNVETCIVLIEESIMVENYSEITHDMNDVFMKLWDKITFQKTMLMSERIKNIVKFGGVEYYDFESKPQCHPVSPEHTLFSHEIILRDKLTGETINTSYFEPGDVIEIKIKYLECDRIPIKNFNPIVEIIEGPKDAKLKIENVISDEMIELKTDDKGQAIFQVMTTTDSEYRDIVLRISKKTNCQNIFDEKVRGYVKAPKYLLNENIIIKSNEKWKGTLDISLTSQYEECVSDVSFEDLAFQFDIWFVIDWQSIELVLNKNPKALTFPNTDIPCYQFGIEGKGIGAARKKPEFSVIGECVDGTINKAEVPDTIDVEVGGGVGDVLSREVGISIKPRQAFFNIIVQEDNEDPLVLYYYSSFRPPCFWSGSGPNLCPGPEIFAHLLWDLKLQDLQPWDITPDSVIKLQLGKKRAEKNGYIEIYYPTKGSYLLKLERVYK